MYIYLQSKINRNIYLKSYIDFIDVTEPSAPPEHRSIDKSFRVIDTGDLRYIGE